MKLLEKIKPTLLYEEVEETNEMQEDFINYIKPLQRQLEIINSDFVLGKITKSQEQELCKPIFEKIEAYERKYSL